MAGSVVEFSAENFDQEVLKSATPVLVDLWAAWCVDPRAHILRDWRNSCAAQSIRTGQQVLSLQGRALAFGDVSSSFVSDSLGHCVEVRTEAGRQLRVTDEHRFLTRRGWKPATELRIGMDVAVYPALEAVSSPTSDMVVLVAEQIRQVGLPRMKLLLYLEELKKNGWLPLTAKHPKLPIVARLMGALLSDGWACHQESNNAREVGFIIGQYEDALQIRDDLASLGFLSRLDERVTRQRIGNRSFSAHTYRVRCRSTSAWLFFKALGAPEGNKTNLAYGVPGWLMRSPPLIQREFLAGYVGGDGPTPMLRLMGRPNKQPCDHLSLNDIEFHKRTDLAANGRRFAQQLARLLRRFGVQVRRIHIEEMDSPRKDGSRAVAVHLSLSATYESGYALCHRIGYAYAASKATQAKTIGEFLRKRLFERDGWERTYRQARRLYQRTHAVHVVAKQLGLHYNTARDWLLRGVSPTIQQHHERYHTWLRRAAADDGGHRLWERVLSVRPSYLPKVARLSVTPHHNFIAEGFIVHNCGPCRLIAPVVEELALKYQGKLKVGKVNVDDHPQVAARLRIMNIPTLLLFKGGKEVDRIVGVVPKEELARRVDHVLT